MAQDSGMMVVGQGVLPPAEGVLLWAMRAWVLARVRTEVLGIEQRIEVALDGLDAREAGCGLCGFMDVIEQGGVRPVTVERMCAEELTDDERALLSVFASVQTGRTAVATRVLREMIGPRSIGAALDRACNVTTALASAGHHLGQPSTPKPKPSPPTLH